jgi:small subunit ribosomal protein S20
MPNTKSAKKEARKNKRRRLVNKKKKEILRGLVKRYRKLVLEKKFTEAETLFPTVQKVLDKAAKTNLIKKNTASRLKSRLAKLITAESQKTAIASKASS